jgi:hypothetical protein
MCSDAGVDREVEAYKAVRAHELTLNEAKAALERGVLTPLIALNGGAIAAFLTLLGALSGKTSTLNVDTTKAKVLVATAVLAWACGLFMAARAVVWASREQGEINRGYRLMRELVEAKLGAPDVAGLIVPPKPDPGPHRPWHLWEEKKKKLKAKADELAKKKRTPVLMPSFVPATATTATERELASRYAGVAGNRREIRWHSPRSPLPRPRRPRRRARRRSRRSARARVSARRPPRPRGPSRSSRALSPWRPGGASRAAA